MAAARAAKDGPWHDAAHHRLPVGRERNRDRYRPGKTAHRKNARLILATDRQPRRTQRIDHREWLLLFVESSPIEVDKLDNGASRNRRLR